MLLFLSPLIKYFKMIKFDLTLLPNQADIAESPNI